ncbi:MAG: 50S ribosomal protein L19e [Minisyncoccales bacterium]
MKLNNQKKIAGKVAKVSPKRVRFDTQRLDEIKESITKADIKGLIADDAIRIKNKKGVSRVRANKIKQQKSKGRQKGPGTKKGKKNARAPKKETWMNKIRLQRNFLKELKEKNIINSIIYRQLYKKSKGGYFRSKRHLKIYLEEHNLVNENVSKQ